MLLTDDLRLALDPVRFAEASGITPDPWQAQLLRSASPRLLLNCSRQVGKSTVVGILACHTALYEPGALVLVLSPSLRQSSELFKRVLAAYRAVGKPVPAEAENALSLTLENGSRVISLPGKEGTIRGFAGVSLLLIDEAARVSDDLYSAVRPMLAVSGGRLALLSTPFGTRGFFHDAYRNRDEWDYYEIPATSCPRITPEFLAEEQRTLGAWWFAQEYQCQFQEGQTQAFRREDIDRALIQEVEQWVL